MINEVYRIQENVTAPDGAEARFSVRYRPDRPEIYRALRLCDRQRFGPVRTALQGGITALIGIGSLIHYLLAEAKPQGELTVAVLCLLFAAVTVLYPPLSAWQLSKQQAAAGRKVYLWLGEEFIGFGKTAETYTRWAYADFALLQTDGLWVLRQGKSSLVVLPMAALSDEAAAFLAERMDAHDQ